ncbi:MAG: tRNA preQ1(34) S-adenosylmethionine ribosyltransferase-isomerase QueA [Acidobacteria bacterium]|nr:tRNA preQ1(34) S-adenosylmethionine ribosyltransferase-isomerase QueA [Acidobacteriota bacterium]
MKLREFRFDLPERLIAQEPARERDLSRLMVLDRRSGRLEHRVFRELPGYLARGDLLVVNDTRVRPARLLARKPTGGSVEVLLLERIDAPAAEGDPDVAQEWRALVRGFGRSEPASRHEYPGGLVVTVTGREEGSAIARVALRAGAGVDRALEGCGLPPTPPYIRRTDADPRLARDRERYQTVFAAAPGAVAAPTAGLHFTPALLDALRSSGVAVSSLTLHVGWGTFQPIRAEEIEDHRVAAEPFEIGESLAEAFRETRARGGRVVAVGTTVARTLEHRATGTAGLAPGSGACDLVIRPGHAFRAVDALITNFHLPESSLLLLVAAFAGRESILAAYAEAVAREYRFYSYGDAMLIL